MLCTVDRKTLCPLQETFAVGKVSKDSAQIANEEKELVKIAVHLHFFRA